MAFHHSSQKQCWTFASRTQLYAMREVACVEAINRIQRLSASLKLDTLLSVEEEDVWLKYYEGKLIEYHESLQLPLKVKATAITYFRRFYLYNSVMDYDPRDMMYAARLGMHVYSMESPCIGQCMSEHWMVCLYLACKTEEARKSLAEFLAATPEKNREEMKDVVLKYELVLLEQMRFQLAVHHPFHAVEGLCIRAKSKGGADKASGVYESAMGLASKAVESDEPLLHPPSHVALACVLAAADAQGVGKEWQQLLGEELKVPSEVLSDAQSLGKEISGYSRQSGDKAVLKEIHKKLKALKEYRMDVDSDEYRQKLRRRLPEEGALNDSA